MSLVESKCKSCGKTFQARPSDLKRGWGLYCSKACSKTKRAQSDREWNDEHTEPPTPDDYRELQAQYDQLQTQLFNERQKSAALAAEVDACNDRNGELEDARAALDKQLSSRISRTVDIEDLLLKMANGKLALPDKQDCRVLSLRLGTPKKDWSDIVKNHEFSLPADKE